MNQFFKYIDGKACQATPLYDGLYDHKQFLMPFKDQFWFDLEIKGINRLQNKFYSPTILNIDHQSLCISIDWENCINLNHAFYNGTRLPVDWKKQIKAIIKDLELSEIYRLNIYPHTFYLKNDKIYITDLYACLASNDLIQENKVTEIINNRDRFLFKDGYLDILYTYNYTIKNNVGQWPEDFLND